MRAENVPYIDPSVEHVGVSRLRSLNAKTLRGIDKTLVFQENDTPLAVLLKYEQFLIMQRQLQSLLDTIEVIIDKDDREALMAGLSDVQNGRLKSLAEIKADLKNKKKKDGTGRVQI